MRPAAAPSTPSRRTGALAAAAGSVLVTGATLPLARVLDPANIVMLYLLATVGIAIGWGRAPAALASVLNVLAFDFFHVPPRLSLAVGDVQYLVTFAVMLAVGLVTAHLAGGLKQQARLAVRREQRAQSLFELARDLADARTAEEVSRRGTAAVGAQFGGDAVVLPEDRQHLEAMARQVAIALDRVHYAEVAQSALVDMESERLRNALLSAISHDLRTPLTALIGLSESLRDSTPPLAPGQAETADAIAAQARSLAQLAHNLLDLARLQAGRGSLRPDWGSLEEVAGAALRELSLPPAAVKARLPADLPLVEFDAVLLQRVLVNLVENAVKYGAAPIEIGAEALPGLLRVTVRDHGPGLPSAWQGREDELFGKFIRGDRESATPGAGLGLAICKAVVEAHGGRIHAANAPSGGAVFTFELPRRDPPPLPA